MPKRHSKYLPHIIYFFDLLIINTAVFFAFYFSSSDNLKQYVLHFLLLVNISWALLSKFSKNYLFIRPLSLADLINRFLITIIYQIVTILSVLYFSKSYEVTRNFLTLYFVLIVILCIFQRSLIVIILDFIRRNGLNRKKILILGNQNFIKKLATSFNLHQEYGYNVFTIDSFDEDLLSNVQKIIEAKIIDEIFISLNEVSTQTLNDLIDVCRNNKVKIKIVPEILLYNPHVEIVNYGDFSVINVTDKENISLKLRILKRSFDLLFSLFVMILGFPIFILLIAITKITSKGPVFYAQERLGKNSKPFKIYKFRSMYVQSENKEHQLTSKKDPRVTTWGNFMRKTKLDELPQFYNVLKGEMSIVGPRPTAQFFIDQVIKKSPSFKRLLNIKPGLTSFGQVDYGYAENVDQMCDRLEYDLKYLSDVSISTDVKVILKTVKVMIQAKGR